MGRIECYLLVSYNSLDGTSYFNKQSSKLKQITGSFFFFFSWTIFKWRHFCQWLPFSIWELRNLAPFSLVATISHRDQNSPFSTNKCGKNWRIRERFIWSSRGQWDPLHHMKMQSSCIPKEKGKDFWPRAINLSVLAFHSPTLRNIDSEDYVDLILCKAAHNTLCCCYYILDGAYDIVPWTCRFLDKWPSKLGWDKEVVIYISKKTGIKYSNKIYIIWI